MYVHGSLHLFAMHSPVLSVENLTLRTGRFAVSQRPSARTRDPVPQKVYATYSLYIRLSSGSFMDCLSSIILSPLNGNVKMSPHATGDIHVESEGTAASERNQRMHQGRHGVCQSRRTSVSERAPN